MSATADTESLVARLVQAKRDAGATIAEAIYEVLELMGVPHQHHDDVRVVTGGVETQSYELPAGAYNWRLSDHPPRVTYYAFTPSRWPAAVDTRHDFELDGAAS